MKLIGLTGLKRCGKSEAARYLIVNHGFQRIAFADPLKAMLEELYSFLNFDETTRIRMLHNDMKNAPVAQGRDSRYLMQTLGTEWGREMVGKDLWVEIFVSRLSRLRGNYVVEDVRFENEAKAVNSLFGKVWRIERANAGPRDDHASEVEQLSIKPDLTIFNHQSLKEFYDNLRGALASSFRNS